MCYKISLLIWNSRSSFYTWRSIHIRFRFLREPPIHQPPVWKCEVFPLWKNNGASNLISLGMTDIHANNVRNAFIYSIFLLNCFTFGWCLNLYKNFLIEFGNRFMVTISIKELCDISWLKIVPEKSGFRVHVTYLDWRLIKAEITWHNLQPFICDSAIVDDFSFIFHAFELQRELPLRIVTQWQNLVFDKSGWHASCNFLLFWS